MADDHKKKLYVEGKDDCYAIAQLMGKHVQWGEKSEDWPVRIEPVGSVSEILDGDYIPSLLQTSSRVLEVVGIVIDADASCSGRWTQLRRLCQASFPDIPEALPPEGLILSNKQGKKLGIWIMPNNSSQGMLETFLKCLVPQAAPKLWEHAQNVTSEAHKLGAPYKDAHKDKADIYTWLSWQDPPGQNVGRAFLSNCLNAHASDAKNFVDWFCNLFGLERLA